MGRVGRHLSACLDSSRCPVASMRSVMAQAASISGEGSDTRGVFRQRRRGGRFCAEVEASLYPGGDELQRRAILISNMSMEGVCFQCETPLAVGSVHVVYLDVEYMWLNSHFEVVRCEQRLDGQYEIGGEFVESAETPPEVASVIGHAAAD